MDKVNQKNYYDCAGIETITLIEDIMSRGLPPVKAYMVGKAARYVLSMRNKKEDIEIAIFNAENYLHRARTGKWIGELSRYAERKKKIRNQNYYSKNKEKICARQKELRKEKKEEKNKKRIEDNL